MSLYTNNKGDFCFELTNCEYSQQQQKQFTGKRLGKKKWKVYDLLSAFRFFIFNQKFWIRTTDFIINHKFTDSKIKWLKKFK